MAKTKKDKEQNHFAEWLEKTNWSKRAKAVCKPCWEIKYCPYGPLVEDFPIGDVNEEKSCRIFGHHCPVFYVAEPFTETKELRNIRRQIPRVVQFRVLKRENQICSNCGKSVKDGEIEFDHIIPWSKGGSSEENNIRLLCITCNRKKGSKFEERYLVKDVNEHVTQPLTETMIVFLLHITKFAHQFRKKTPKIPSPQDYADGLAKGELTVAEKIGAEYFQDMLSFFTGPKPNELSKSQFEALKFRWGFSDGNTYSIKDVKKYLHISTEEYFAAEKGLIRRLGIRMSDSRSVMSNWKKL